MTIQDAIELVDRLKPNQYPETLKIQWLSKLDGQIFDEVFAAHEGSAIESFAGYNEDTPQDTELLVPHPFDTDLYSYYLQAAIDRENAETTKYNQSITLYNNAYLTFQNWYNRTHMPRRRGLRFRF